MKNKIKFIREEKNITQEKLSELSGVSRTIISGLENGTIYRTTNTTMQKLSKALGVEIFELFYI